MGRDTGGRKGKVRNQPWFSRKSLAKHGAISKEKKKTKQSGIGKGIITAAAHQRNKTTKVTRKKGKMLGRRETRGRKSEHLVRAKTRHTLGKSEGKGEPMKREGQ